MFHVRTALIVLVVSSFWFSVSATAQPLGTFRWQLQPYCNVLTLNISHRGGIYTLDGTDDRCGAAQTASAQHDPDAHALHNTIGRSVVRRVQLRVTDALVTHRSNLLLGCRAASEAP